MNKVYREGCGAVPVSAIQLGQLWRSDETGDNWLVTKLYSEAFTSYAMLRKVGGTDADVRRVKVEKSAQAATLPGFTYTQDYGSF